MATYRVSSRLDRLTLRFDYVIVCADMRSSIVSHEPKDEFGCETCQWGVTLTNPVEYTREEILKKYDGKTKVYRWVYTYTEDGKDAIAIVLDEKRA